jgi:FkbM family methyltransferase
MPRRSVSASSQFPNKQTNNSKLRKLNRHQRLAMLDRFPVPFAATLLTSLAHARLFHFIEIGTSNFETAVQTYHFIDFVNGLSVEPLNHLLQDLPRGKNTHLVNAAISDYDGEGIMYYTKQEYMEPYCTGADLERLGLELCMPWWFKAAGSLDRISDLVAIHAGNVVNESQVSASVRVMRYSTLLREYGVTSVNFLKVDTEGVDHHILNQVLDNEIGFLPRKIQFEVNNLTKSEIYDDLYERLIDSSYVCHADLIDAHGMNMNCRLINYPGEEPGVTLLMMPPESEGEPGADETMKSNGFGDDDAIQEFL